ncbi:MAG: hypothetical protein BGO67_02075 [Alphaproteobacteria bacterium 41-28]|nr:MAG: hypothetical protein BGO67_02075 [Alphaproteobacteria bacterium 41-28]
MLKKFLFIFFIAVTIVNHPALTMYEEEGGGDEPKKAKLHTMFEKNTDKKTILYVSQIKKILQLPQARRNFSVKEKFNKGKNDEMTIIRHFNLFNFSDKDKLLQSLSEDSFIEGIWHDWCWVFSQPSGAIKADKKRPIIFFKVEELAESPSFLIKIEK